MREKVVVSWSSGKDSALALDRARKDGHEVVSLVSTLRDDGRVSVHGVPRELLREQSRLLGIPLKEIYIGGSVSYEDAVSEGLRVFREQGVERVVYGDLFLEDIRKWRDTFHEEFGMKCLYPIWGMDTQSVAETFLESGYKAIVVCVDTKHLGASFAGREYNRSFIDDLPTGIDPCGENGEFHTFVYGGPSFSSEIAFEAISPKIRVFKDPGHTFEFSFCDLIPLDASNLKT